MDRQAWIAVTLCVMGFVALQVYNAKHMPPPPPVPATASPTPTAPPENQATTAASQPPSVSPSPGASPTPTPAASIPPFAEKTEMLANADVELRLTNRGAAISDVVLLNHMVGSNGQRVVLNGPDRIPIGAIVQQPDAPLSEYTVARQADGSVQFEHKTPEGLTISKKFFFPPASEAKDNYAVEMAIDFRNDGALPYDYPPYFVTLGSTRPIHPNDMSIYTRLVWCVNGEAKGADVDWFGAGGGFVGIGQHEARPIYRETVPGAQWAAMSNQFFTTILTPLNAKVGEVWAKRVELKRGDGKNVFGIEGAMALPGFELKPGQTNTLRVELYTGPKLYRRLATLGHDEAEIMNFSNFTILKLVSQALLNFMNLLHSWVGNYGVAIILLTACVKAVLWPLQNKANKSMRKMSALAPKMQELKEKYKEDPTRMNQEVMKLYKEHGVNPVGGCLPMVIQIPIFFGLFNMLGQVAELRNATFLWVKDLSQPDILFVIPGMGWVPIIGNPEVGLPINVLPILMGATNVWLMRMTPKTGDATQRRIMMFMPLIFLIFCYNFAAALALYYTTQNLFTILQLWQNQKQPLPVLEKVAPAGKKSRKGRP
jgi:YidC/Oxa1 family membrane protein insertase